MQEPLSNAARDFASDKLHHLVNNNKQGHQSHAAWLANVDNRIDLHLKYHAEKKEYHETLNHLVCGSS